MSFFGRKWSKSGQKVGEMAKNWFWPKNRSKNGFFQVFLIFGRDFGTIRRLGIWRGVCGVPEVK